jgi:hypothetical protein
VWKETTALLGASAAGDAARIELPLNPLPGEMFFSGNVNDDNSGAIEKLREEELEEARSIQIVMLPAESLRTNGVRISHAFQRVTEVGGDFLDYFELTDGVLGLYLGDVSGKGLPTAMYAPLVVGTLRGVHKTGLCPSQVLSTLSRRLIIRGRRGGMQRDVRSAHTDDEDYVRGDAGALSSDDEGLSSA